jgi:hypothetical protein
MVDDISSYWNVRDKYECVEEIVNLNEQIGKLRATITQLKAKEAEDLLAKLAIYDLLSDECRGKQEYIDKLEESIIRVTQRIERVL